MQQALEQFEQFLTAKQWSYSKDVDTITVDDIVVGKHRVEFFEGEYGWVNAMLAFERTGPQFPQGKIANLLEFQTTINLMFGGRIDVGCEAQDFYLIGHVSPKAELAEQHLHEFVHYAWQVLPIFMQVMEHGRWESQWEVLILDANLQGRA